LILSLLQRPGRFRCQAKIGPHPPLTFLRAEPRRANQVAHGRVLRPLLELGHHFLLGLLPFTVQPLLLHPQPRAAVVAPAQFHDVLAQPAQRPQLAPEALRHFAIPTGEGGGVPRRQHGGQVIRQPPVRGRRQFRGIRGQLTGLRQRLLPRLPFHEAGGPPLAEVLFADRHAAELPRQHRLHGGQRVEPGEQRAARLVVLQT
jgi:hypothetical protein